MKRLIGLTVLYAALIVGYLCIYVLDMDLIIYGEENSQPRSKTNFVYQQF